jgi:amino acid permease
VTQAISSGEPGQAARLFTRDELLGGLPARRASTILFAIEGATARLVAASRIDRAAYISERTAADRERAFLRALSNGSELPRPPAIADIERVSAGWADLVPDAPDVRAAMARLLGAKYRFRRGDVPGLRTSLGLDDPAVGSAFARLHGRPLDLTYAEQLSIAERMRWLRSRLGARFDRLPPFWIAYFLALTETLGEGILAVPIALAGLGAVPGVILLLVLGAINLVTMGALTESVTRNGSMRYGAAYFSRLATDLLGRVPASALSLALGLFNVLTFFVYFLGFGSVLAGATGIPMAFWILGLFALNLFVLRKESLDDTVASAVLVGGANLALVVAITAIALLEMDPANLGLASVPLLDGRPIDALTLGLVLGIVLTAFFGHTSAANASKLVLRLEPSGRSLLWGNLAALATVIALYCCAAVAFLGVLGPEPLVGTTGTAITPLGEAIPVVQVLGSLYVVLAVGIGSLYITLGLYNQVVELLPRPSDAPGGLLARMSASRRGRLCLGFAPAAAVCLGLEILVLTGQDSFADAIGIGGALLVPIITGVFPMLLLVAARRKGEYVPGSVLRLIGHPLVVGGLVAFFVVVLALHGLVIWEGPLERLAALFVSTAMVGLVAWTRRSHAYRRRAVVEIRRDRRSERTTLSVTTAGRSIVLDAPVDADAESAGEPVSATALVPPGPWRDLRIWPHDVSADGWSTQLTADIDVDGRPIVTGDAGADNVVPIDGTAKTVRVILTDAARA